MQVILLKSTPYMRGAIVGSFTTTLGDWPVAPICRFHRRSGRLVAASVGDSLV